MSGDYVNGTSAIDPKTRCHLIEKGGCPWCTIEMYRSVLRTIRGELFEFAQLGIIPSEILPRIDGALNISVMQVRQRREKGERGTYTITHEEIPPMNSTEHLSLHEPGCEGKT